MIRISPSLLGTWDNVKTGAYNTTEKTLEDYILGVFTPSSAMRRGTAYHLLLENGPERYRNEKGEYQILVDTETFTFTEQAARPAIELHELYTGGAHEVWGRWETKVEGEDIISHMRIDLLNGAIINEFKTSSRPKKYLDYLMSWQWKMYCLAFPDAQGVMYHNFALNTGNTDCHYSSFYYAPYADMEKDVVTALGGLVAYLKRKPELYRALEKKVESFHVKW
jgi:hypothetical protein